jgi:hypothetical protein
MISGRTILKRLRNIEMYLGQFRYKESIYFENIIGMALSKALYLPFYTKENDDENVRNRVVWGGSEQNGNLAKAPQGKSDIVAYCYGFFLAVEVTQKTGSGQWTDEFAQAVRHCDDFVKANGIEPNDVYIILITKKLHVDTYCSLRNYPRRKHKFVPIETEVLIRILQTAILALTIRHFELRTILNKISECLINSSSLSNFRIILNEELKNWQKQVLKREKRAFIGIKSYETMRKNPRSAVAVSEILQELLKHPFVGQYFKILKEELDPSEIEKALIEESLCCYAGKTIQTDEFLFECIPCTDFKGRGLRFINAIENA